MKSNFFILEAEQHFNNGTYCDTSLKRVAASVEVVHRENEKIAQNNSNMEKIINACKELSIYSLKINFDKDYVDNKKDK